MRTFAALRMRPGGTVSAGIFVCFYIALKILTCYYQCRKRRPWEYGQRERNVVRVSLLGEVHRRYDGAPSSSGERRRREGHRVSLHIYVASYFIMDILMNFLIFRIFIGKRLRQRQRKWAATFGGGQQRSGGSEGRQ